MRRPAAVTAVAAALALTFALAGGDARAQKTPPDDAATAEAKARFKEGITLADQGEHEAARLKFGQAWTLLKSPGILFNLARSEQLSNHLIESLEHFRLYRKLVDPKITEEQRKRAAEYIAQIVPRICQLEIDAPATARVVIDGKSMEWAPDAEPIPVLPGAHTVEATVDGKPTSTTVDCAAGATAKARLDVAPPVPPKVGLAAPAPRAVATTEAKSGFWTTGRAVGAGLIGGGLLALGAGAFFHLRATGAADDAEALRTKLGPSGCAATVSPRPAECDALAEKNDTESSSANLRAAFLIGGGALVVGGAALFLLSAPKRETALHLTPYATPTDAGLRVFGDF